MNWGVVVAYAYCLFSGIFILYLVGRVHFHREMSDHWRQCCENRQKTIQNLLAIPVVGSPERCEFFEDRQRPN